MKSTWTMDWLELGDKIPAALLLSLFSVWVLVGLFYYLNHFTRRGYFNLWTCAWVCYALWLTMGIHPLQATEDPLLILIRYGCISASAVYLLWGSLDFRKIRLRKQTVGWLMGAMFAWSALATYVWRNHLAGEASIFSVAGLASMIAGWGFLRMHLQREQIGTGLLVGGFFAWGACLIAFPFLQKSEPMVILGFVVSAASHLFIAVSMIILVMEETRASKETALHQIRAHKTAQEILENKYRTIFDHAKEGIIITDAGNLSILELNPEAERLLGICGTEAVEFRLPGFIRTVADAGPVPEECGAWMEWIRQQQKLHVVCHDGGMIPILMHGTMIQHDGKPACQFFIRELTEWARLDRQLRQAEKLAALGRMISGIAHELNNPLAVIKGYLDLILSRHELPVATRSDLLKVAHESNRAAKLVGNFLAFAREESSQRQAVNFNDLIRQIVELRQFEFRNANVELALDLAEPLPATQANGDQMQQILVNLMTNAFQAMESVPPPHRLALGTRLQDDKVQVFVEDNGPGVPDHLANKIFEPYFTTKGAGMGTGLGLSISYRIISEHQGRLFYEKVPEGGARFVVELPLIEDTKAGVVPPAIDTIEKEAKYASMQTAAKILVVDDEPSIAELLGESLTLLGFTPTLCSFAPQALEIIENADFDLVISDMRMPVLDGRQFYELVTQRKPELSQRFIFLTGDVVNEETQAFLKSTGNVYLAKPFHLSKVEQVIAQILHDQAAAQAPPKAVPLSQGQLPTTA